MTDMNDKGEQILVPKRSDTPSFPQFDGLRLMVQFYANHGCLRQVEKRSGVPVLRLRQFADSGEITDADRGTLESSIEEGHAGSPLSEAEHE